MIFSGLCILPSLPLAILLVPHSKRINCRAFHMHIVDVCRLELHIIIFELLCSVPKQMHIFLDDYNSNWVGRLANIKSRFHSARSPISIFSGIWNGNFIMLLGIRCSYRHLGLWTDQSLHALSTCNSFHMRFFFFNSKLVARKSELALNLYPQIKQKLLLWKYVYICV